MEPTQIRIGMMDSRRPAEVVTVPAEHLSVRQRLARAARNFFAVTGGGLVLGNVGLILFPVPHFHLCLFPIALLMGPLAAWFGWDTRVRLPAGELPCPRCHGTVPMPEGLHGWPVRFNCERCAIMIELTPAR